MFVLSAKHNSLRILKQPMPHIMQPCLNCVNMLIIHRNQKLIFLHIFLSHANTRSTQRAQTSLAEADHYSHIARVKMLSLGCERLPILPLDVDSINENDSVANPDPTPRIASVHKSRFAEVVLVGCWMEAVYYCLLLCKR